jgi:anti-sigma factor RsiW
MTLSDQDELLLSAFIDGELSSIEAFQFENRLRAEPGLAAALEARRALRTALRADRADDIPSPQLQRRIAGLARKPSSTGSWQSMAASFVLGLLLAGGIAWGVIEHGSRQDVTDQVVSAHIRGLMSSAPTDVLSSERHTIKPWFNGRINFAPVVADLSAEGYTLVGARIDVVDLSPAATLVYSRGKHIISVTEMPGAEAPASSTSRNREQGYLLFAWSDGRMRYWAVSDAAPEELERFVKLFQAASSTS